MGYYMRGDYYRRGDLFGSIGSVLGGIGKVATGFLSGGPVGGAIGVVSALSSMPKPKGSSFPAQVGQQIREFARNSPFGPTGPFSGKPLTGKRPKKGEPGWHPRRMHVTNPKALRRAIRRAQGFEKLAMKVLSFSRPHGKPKGHPYFKRKRAAR